MSAQNAANNLWLLTLPDDVLRVVFSEYLSLRDFVSLDSAMCHHRTRHTYLDLLNNLKLTFYHEILYVKKNCMEGGHAFLNTTAEYQCPRSATFSQFHFILTRKIVVPQIFIQARLSNQQLRNWSTVLATVKNVKFEPNEAERMKSKSLLRYLRALSGYITNMESFEFVPYWSLYHYDDDEGCDAGDGEKLDSEMSADFMSDVSSNVSSADSSINRDEDTAVAPLPPKTLVNILVAYFPRLQHIVLKSIIGLEPVYLIPPAMLNTWTNLRTLHLHEVTLFLKTYYALFAALATEDMAIESFSITLPMGEMGRSLITHDVFLPPLQPLIPANLDRTLRHLKHLSGTFLLIYPIYFYLCGNSRTLQSLDLVCNFKQVELYMMQMALHQAHALHLGRALPTTLHSFHFKGERDLLQPDVQAIVSLWLQSTIFCVFQDTLRDICLRNIVGSVPIPRDQNSETLFRKVVPRHLESLKYAGGDSTSCLLPQWSILSTILASSYDTSLSISDENSSLSGYHGLRRLQIEFPYRKQDLVAFYPSVLLWINSLVELSVNESPIALLADRHAGQRTVSQQLFATSSYESENLPERWIFSALKKFQLNVGCDDNEEVFHVLRTTLSRMPRLEILNITKLSKCLRLSEEITDLIIEYNSRLRILALPVLKIVDTNALASMIGKLFFCIPTLRHISVFYFVDSRSRYVGNPPDIVEAVNVHITEAYNHVINEKSSLLQRQRRPFQIRVNSNPSLFHDPEVGAAPSLLLSVM